MLSSHACCSGTPTLCWGETWMRFWSLWSFVLQISRGWKFLLQTEIVLGLWSPVLDFWDDADQGAMEGRKLFKGHTCLKPAREPNVLGFLDEFSCKQTNTKKHQTGAELPSPGWEAQMKSLLWHIYAALLCISSNGCGDLLTLPWEEPLSQNSRPPMGMELCSERWDPSTNPAQQCKSPNTT